MDAGGHRVEHVEHEGEPLVVRHWQREIGGRAPVELGEGHTTTLEGVTVLSGVAGSAGRRELKRAKVRLQRSRRERVGIQAVVLDDLTVPYVGVRLDDH